MVSVGARTQTTNVGLFGCKVQLIHAQQLQLSSWELGPRNLLDTENGREETRARVTQAGPSSLPHHKSFLLLRSQLHPHSLEHSAQTDTRDPFQQSWGWCRASRRETAAPRALMSASEGAEAA